jgi:hypothetical protein
MIFMRVGKKFLEESPEEGRRPMIGHQHGGDSKIAGIY